MPIIYASPEERRRGGWLTRAEGRVKTKGVPIGPRPASLQRILDKAENKSFPSASPTPPPGDGYLDARDVRREVGSGKRNDAADVIAVKQVLQEAGLYEMPCPASPSPYFDSRMRVAIRIFQGRLGLKQDGVIRPGDLRAKAPNDANAARCRQLAVDIGNAELDLDDFSDEVNKLNKREIELSGKIEPLWNKIERELIKSTVSFLASFVRLGNLLGKLRNAIRGGATDVQGIYSDVQRVQSLEDEQKLAIKEKERFLRLQAAQRAKLNRLLSQRRSLGCGTR